MKKEAFKYELGQKVMRIGFSGPIVVSGRGRIDYISGGSINLYQTSVGYLPEYELCTVDEWKSYHQ